MSWDELEVREDRKPKEDERFIPVRQAAIRAFGSDAQKPLREELDRIVRRASYAAGRSAEEVAFNEGYRKLALDLLTLGGVYERRD